MSLACKKSIFDKVGDALAGKVMRWILVKDIDKDCKKRKEMPS